MNVEQFVRPDIAALEPYTPIQPLDVLSENLGIPIADLIKLDANENPFGPAPGVLKALASEPHYAIYPDPDQLRLRRAISAWIGHPIERIICGNGSDELIDLLMRVLVQPGTSVIACPPTFGMYSFNTGVVGGEFVAVPRLADYSIDVAGIAAAVERTSARMVFLPSPNNPTGNSVSRASVEQLLALPTVLVLDEAYAEFSGTSVADMVGHYPNLVVLRTFSKWAGLAGLRIGYGLLPEWLIQHVWKIKPPYNINVAAEAAALRSLAEADILQERVAQICAERERLYAALVELPGLQPFPSQANFILCQVTAGDAATLKHKLMQQGILVRYYRNAELRNCIRISVGMPEQHERLLSALSALLPTL